MPGAGSVSLRTERAPRSTPRGLCSDGKLESALRIRDNAKTGPPRVHLVHLRQVTTPALGSVALPFRGGQPRILTTLETED